MQIEYFYITCKTNNIPISLNCILCLVLIGNAVRMLTLKTNIVNIIPAKICMLALTLCARKDADITIYHYTAHTVKHLDQC